MLSILKPSKPTAYWNGIFEWNHNTWRLIHLMESYKILCKFTYVYFDTHSLRKRNNYQRYTFHWWALVLCCSTSVDCWYMVSRQEMILLKISSPTIIVKIKVFGDRTVYECDKHLTHFHWILLETLHGGMGQIFWFITVVKLYWGQVIGNKVDINGRYKFCV